MPIEMRIKGLVVDPLSKMPIIVLEDLGSERVLPIWIGVFEANAIALTMEKVPTPRPMTHDLMLKIVQELGGKLQKVVIDKLENNTFHAKLHILKEDGQEVVIDSRPSDSVAIALRAKVPVFVEEDILKTASVYEV